jgi:hypothetical protein
MWSGAMPLTFCSGRSDAVDEATWLTCQDPTLMLEWLYQEGKLTERKARLFASAVCRCLWAALTDERLRKGVEMAEQLAEGQVSGIEARQASSDVQEVLRGLGLQNAGALAVLSAVSTAPVPGCPFKQIPAARAVHSASWATRADADSTGHQPALLRDICGPLPFRPLSFDRSLLEWNDGLVVKLAQSAYDERLLPSGHLDTARLAVLADALEEAGADDAELLTHLRSPGPHVRGCAGLDLVLGNQ